MTIEQLADELGVSARTVYRRAEKAGISTKECRDEKGELTPEGVCKLATLFDSDSDKKKARQTLDADKLTEEKPVTQPVMAPDAELIELKGQVQTLTAQLAAAQRERELLREMLEAERQRTASAEANAAAWKDQAERAQELHSMEMQRLLPDREHAGLWQRIRGVFQKGESKNVER